MQILHMFGEKYLQSFCGLSIRASSKLDVAAEAEDTEHVGILLLQLMTSSTSSLGPALPMLSRFHFC